MTAAPKQLQRMYPHLNLRWSLDDMWRMQERARDGAPADVLAFEFNTTIVEIMTLATRNGFFVKPARGMPGLASVSIQRGSE